MFVIEDEWLRINHLSPLFSKMVSRAFREIVEDHYDLMEKIGEGTYGDVFKACRKVPP